MSSVSQDESIERIDNAPGSDKQPPRKFHHSRDNSLSGSNSKHPEQYKFQNSGHSNSYDLSEGPSYLNGSQLQDESTEYNQENMKLTKDNLRNLSELEAVPERSIEHSDINKMSYMDSEAHRWQFEQEGDDVRGSKGILHLPKNAKDSKLDQDLEEFIPANTQPTEKGGLHTFISPRFQVQSSGKKRNSKSREREQKSHNRDEGVRRLSQKNYNTLYNDTFNRKNLEHKSFYNDREENSFDNAQVRHSTPTEPTYSQNMKNYLGRFSHKVSPRNNRQNLSAFEFNVGERTSDRSNHTRLNKTELMIPYSREDSFQIQDSSDLTRLVHVERERNERLEEKINSKEKLLRRMKEFHDKLYKDYMITKTELEKVYEERNTLVQEVNHNNSKNQKMNERFKELEVRLRTLTDENNKLAKADAQKVDVIRELEDQLANMNTNLDLTLKKHEAKVESLTNKLNKYSRENKELLQQRSQIAEKLDRQLRRGSPTDDEEKHILRRNLEETGHEIRSLVKRNDELVQEIEALKKQGPNAGDRSRIHYSRLDDSGVENRRGVLEERVNQSRVESVHHSRIESSSDAFAKYKHKIAQLEAANENLRLELQSRPSLRKFKENEVKIHSLENELEGTKHHPHPHHGHGQGHEHRKSTTEINFTGKILKEIITELEIENIGDILPRIKEIQESSKINNKFVDSLLDLVARCSPAGSFEGRPNVKQAWKWIKRLMEEYMNMKKEGKEGDDAPNQEILRSIMDYLMVQDPSEVQDKFRSVLVENNLMQMVISKVKEIHNLEYVASLQDLKRKLDKFSNGKINGPENRSRHSQVISN